MQGSDLRQGRRSFLRTLTLGAGGAVLAACAGAATPTPAPSKPAKPETAAATAPAKDAATPAAAPKAGALSGQIRLHIRTGPYHETWKDVGKIYNEKFPNVELKFEAFPASELTQKLETMAAGATIGDIYFIPTVWMDHQRFASLGISRSVDEHAKGDNLDWGQWFKVAVEQLKVGGKTYGMLDGASPGRAGLYYSKTAFKEAGVPEPDESWTMDKLVEVGPKLTKDGSFAFRPTHASAPEILIWPRAYGGDIISKDGKQATLTSAEAKKGITWVYDGMHKLKIFPKPDQMQEGISSLFAAKKLASFNSGTWDANMANATKIEWSLVPLPKGPAGVRGSMAEANIINMTTASKNPDAAWEFLKADASREGGIFHLDHGVTPGGRPDVYNDPKVQEKYWWMKVWAKVFEEALPYNGPHNFRGSEISDAIKQGLDPLWIGQATPDSGVIETTNQAVQAILDKPMP